MSSIHLSLVATDSIFLNKIISNSIMPFAEGIKGYGYLYILAWSWL